MHTFPLHGVGVNKAHTWELAGKRSSSPFLCHASSADHPSAHAMRQAARAMQADTAKKAVAAAEALARTSTPALMRQHGQPTNALATCRLPAQSTPRRTRPLPPSGHSRAPAQNCLPGCPPWEAPLPTTPMMWRP